MLSALIWRSNTTVFGQRQQKMHIVLPSKLLFTTFPFGQPQTFASASQRWISVSLMPTQECAAPTRSSALCCGQRKDHGSCQHPKPTSPAIHPTVCNFKSRGDAIHTRPESSSLQSRNRDSPCAPCRWRSLRRCRRLHRNPRCTGNCTHAAPAALG